MRTRAFFRTPSVLLAVMAVTGALSAHHSPSAIFDMGKSITITGTLTEIRWVNPHIVLQLDAKGDGGKVTPWRFQSNPPRWFQQVGVGRADFSKAIGHAVTIECVRARDGSTYGYMQKITFPDKTELQLVIDGPVEPGK